MKIDIVACQPKHAKEIAEICAIGWRQTVEGQFSDKYMDITTNFWYREERVKNDIEKGNYRYSAIVDGKVVGTIGGILTEEKISWIWVFYINEAYRYKGIGKQLLHTYTNEHIQAGATEQWVSVQDQNTLGIPFYKANGFRAEKRVETKTETDENLITWHYKRILKN